MAVPAFITSHAIDRYLERVDSTLTRPEAAAAIRAIAATARTRSTPRRWTGVAARPGSQYLFSAAHPGICLIQSDGRIRTVLHRATSRQWRHTERRYRLGAA